MLRCAVTFIFLGICLSSAIAGDNASEAIRSVISKQIEAFRQDDGAEAFALASPNIQKKYGNADLFMEIVKTRYRPVYRPKRVQFLELAEGEGQIVQKVLLTISDQETVLALYPMIKVDGTWRIDGCFLRDAPGEET